MIEMNKKGVAELLGIKNMRRMTVSQVKSRLKSKGYEIVKIEKRGRNVIYVMKQLEEIPIDKDYIEETFKVKNANVFLSHTNDTLEECRNNTPTMRGEKAKKHGITRNTSYVYDKKLIEKEILSEDGYYYICMNKRTKEKCLVTEKIYNAYWSKNSSLEESLDVIGEQYDEGKISRKVFIDTSSFLLDTKNSGEYRYYKISKYSVNENSMLLMLIQPLLDKVKEELGAE